MLIGIFGVGAALGGLVLTLGGLMLSLQSRTDKRLDAFGGELSGLRSELRALGERVARLEGLIKGSGLFRPFEPSEATGDHPPAGGPTEEQPILLEVHRKPFC